MKAKSKKVFVAGHRGLVGSALIRNFPKNFELVVADRSNLLYTDPVAVENFLFKNDVDTVILAAAKVGGIGANSEGHKEFLLQNLSIQNAFFSAASRVRVSNFVFLGSSCIYPKFAIQPISESSLLSGELESSNEGYALAKIAGVRLAKAIYEEERLNFFSLMPTNLYGPNDNFDLKTSHVPAALLRRFHEAKISKADVVEVWGSGTPRREFMHVDDLASACWKLLDVDMRGQHLNVGTGIDISISSFAHLIAQVVGYQGKIAFDNSRLDGTPQKLLDVSKIHSFGWSHQISLLDGIQRTYDWYLDALERGTVRGQ